ncbi:M48 family metallopeptidase [Salinirubrum litoreum]|uniref:M48 family metallopeptidase n=1 Tax=Salinirubrum litoreum TaxID=1126234 RepID=A0ABD5REU4_9EURY|nr:M48 family metalloprotease [Salinirubrum litoreum]
MRRLALRLSMLLVGVSVFAVYAGGAYLSLLLLRSLWVDGLSLETTVVVVVGSALLFSYLSYRVGTRQTLVSLDAVAVDARRAPTVHGWLDRFTARMEIGRPALYVATMQAPNALALGSRGSGAVVLDRSLFRLLEPAELRAIVAHELAHLESRDSLVQTLALGLFRTLFGVVLVALFPVSLLLTGITRGVAWAAGRPQGWDANPVARLRRAVGQVLLAVFVAVTLLVRAHSRRREFAADDRAVEVTGDPLALARALRKIERASSPEWSLLSPLYVHDDEDRDRWTRLLSTHPPVDDRVDRLVERAESDRSRGAVASRGRSR